MKHALVVGGTGMLQNVSIWLIEKGYHVSVIARNPRRMENLIAKVSSKNNVTPILVDYANGKELQEKIKHTTQQNGIIDMVVAWIHSYAEDALPIIAGEVSKHKNGWELFHVLGSASTLDAIKRKATVPEGCIYHQVLLGFVIEGSHSRWLTNKEIANGVIAAIKEKREKLNIGVLEPWEKRP